MSQAVRKLDRGTQSSFARQTTSTTSTVRLPAGLWKRTVSPARDLSSARANGASHLTRPRAKPVSSPPDDPIGPLASLVVADRHRLPEERLLGARAASRIDDLGEIQTSSQKRIRRSISRSHRLP